MDTLEISNTLQYLLQQKPYPRDELEALLTPLRFGAAFEDLLEEFFTQTGNGWSFRSGQQSDGIRDHPPPLSEETKTWLKDLFHTKLAASGQAQEVSAVLGSMSEEERGRLPFDWLDQKSLSTRSQQTARILRHDLRFIRYEGYWFGLTEWDDAVHLNYWWSALEEAFRGHDTKRFEACAAQVERLNLMAHKRIVLQNIIAMYRREGSLLLKTHPSHPPLCATAPDCTE